MQKYFLYIPLLLMLLLPSCAKVYYQVHHIVSPNVTSEKHEMIYENEDCVISYNFWKDGGQPGFEIYNKTNENLYLDLAETHFIKNGIAYNYFKNRTFSEANNVTIGNKKSKTYVDNLLNYLDDGTLTKKEIESTKVSVTSHITSAAQEEKLVCIPPQSAKFIKEYLISPIPFKECDYKHFPSRNQVSVLRFTQENSPIAFRNRITYFIGSNPTEAPRVIDNDFYVSNIVNVPLNEITDKITRNECGERLSRSGREVNSKYAKPDNFYIEYIKGGY